MHNKLVSKWLVLLILFSVLVVHNTALAQCSTSTAPTYSSSCTSDYFTSITASGTGVVSTVAVTGVSCTGITYFNYYATQGVTAPAGTTVNFSFHRSAVTYTAYQTIYIDWNNDGIYQTTELAGVMTVYPGLAMTYPFTIPLTGFTTGINLHMRAMMSELSTGAPCTANWGQTCDFYLNVTCPPPPTISFTPSSGTICAGSSLTITASGAGTGGTYTWSPSSTLSASTGTTVVATPTTTTIYTVNGTTSIGCTGTNTVTVTVNPSPIVTVTPSGPLTFCAGDSVILTATAGAGYSYQWYNGGTLIAGATNISYTAIATGNYKVVVTNGFGCSTTSSITVVTVNPLPTATITAAGVTTFCAGGNVTLNASTGAGYTYQWFNTGVVIGGAVSSSYSATSSGSYVVVVTSGAGCTDTSTAINVTVNPLPNAIVTASGPTTFCAGGSVVLTASAGSGYTYQWYNGATPIVGATNISYTATTTGNYKVVVTNGFGCVATSTVTVVTVNPMPTAVITPGGSTTFCAGGSVVLNATTGGSYTYQWYNTGTLIPGATAASYTANASGTYVVVVTGTGGCNTTSAAITIVVNPTPSPTVIYAGGLNICVGDSVTLTASSGTGYTYQWYNGATLLAGATNTVYVAHITGSFYVKETNSFGCSANSAPVNITVNNLPDTTVTASGPTTFCIGGSVTLSVPLVAGYIYQWYSGGAPIAGATNNTYTATSTGNYTVRVTNVAAGCTNISHHPIVVAEISAPVILATGTTTFCWGGSILLSTNVAGAAGIIYQWYLNGVAIPGAIYSTFYALTGGVYTLQISIAGGCTATTGGLTITVNSLPNPTISWMGFNLVTENYFASYQWYKNLVLISGANTWHYYPTSNGDYKVIVTDTSGCQSASAVYALTTYMGDSSTLGVNNNLYLATDDVVIYPNPAQTTVHIVSAVAVTAVVTAIDGRILLSQPNATEVDLQMLNPGMYFITLFDEGGKCVKREKLLKQ